MHRTNVEHANRGTSHISEISALRVAATRLCAIESPDWRPVWEALEQHWRPHRRARDGAPASRARSISPKHSRIVGPGGRKRDFPDAERLVKRLVAQELTLSFAPDTEQRLWRTVMRRKHQITRNRVQLHNRLEALLDRASSRTCRASAQRDLVIRAILGLQQLQARSATPDLVRLLHHRNATVRRYAASTLRVIADGNIQVEMRAVAADLLAREFDNRALRACMAANDALQRLTGENLQVDSEAPEPRAAATARWLAFAKSQGSTRSWRSLDN